MKSHERWKSSSPTKSKAFAKSNNAPRRFIFVRNIVCTHSCMLSCINLFQNRKIYEKFWSLLQVGTRKYTTIRISNWNFLVLVLLTGSTQYPSHLALLINQLMISNQSHIKKFNFLLFMINLFPAKWIEATVEQFTVLWCAVLCSELAYRKHTQIKPGL